MSILTWLFQLCHILIIKVVTICLLPSIHILIPNISRIELHIYLTKLFLPVNIILVHLCDTTHTAITVSIYISQRIGNYLLPLLPGRILDKISRHKNLLIIKLAPTLLDNIHAKQYVQAVLKATDLQRLPADVKAAAPLSRL